MAVLDIVLDLAILSLPLPVIRGLQISARRKVSVAGIFLLGILWVGLAPHDHASPTNMLASLAASYPLQFGCIMRDIFLL